MTMKKLFYMASILMVAALTLTACGGDDEPQTTATATYTLTFSPDLLDACSVLIYYKSDNGDNSFDPIKTTRWTKVVTSDRFPAEFGVKYKFGVKPNSELNKETYNLSFDVNFSIKNSKGDTFNKSVTIIEPVEVDRDHVKEVLERYDNQSIGYRYSINGIPSEANNMDYD